MKQTLINDSTTNEASAFNLCQLALELTWEGDYVRARETLDSLWTEEARRDAHLSKRALAEVLLRVGSIAGWLGSANQTVGSQERAKDLLTRSLRIFEELDDYEKQAEVQVDLAICYWRTGAFDEARVMLSEAECKVSQTDGFQKLRVILQLAMIDLLTARPFEALNRLSASAHHFESSDNHAARGRFHNHTGMALRSLWSQEGREEYLDRAIVEYTASSYYFEQANNIRFEAAVENNLGFLCMKAERHIEAHVHLDRARRLFEILKDHLHIARVNDSAARLYIAEGKTSDALRLSRLAVLQLEKGEERAVLCEALTTHSIVLARLKRFNDARQSFERAISEAERAGDMNGAGLASLSMIEELYDILTPGELISTYMRADAFLERSNERDTLIRLRQAARTLMQSLPHIQAAFSASVTKATNLKDQTRNFITQFEALAIKRALNESDGHITQAARRLGISHQVLTYKLSKQSEDVISSRRPPRVRHRSIIKKK